LWLTHDRPAHCHPLALPAGQRARLALQEGLQVEDPGRVLHAPVDLVLGHLLDAEAEGDVLVHREVGVQRVALEDHRDVAITRRDMVDDPLADPDHALAHRLEAGEHAERGRLAAAGGPDQHHELPVGDVQLEIRDGSCAVRVDLACPIERDAGHLAPARPERNQPPLA
jgi:hypothetical protein